MITMYEMIMTNALDANALLNTQGCYRRTSLL
jgi:hypothetical protein